MGAQSAHESTENFQKGVTPHGRPGDEKLAIATKDAKLIVVEVRRFPVTIGGDGTGPEVDKEY